MIDVGRYADAEIAARAQLTDAESVYGEGSLAAAEAMDLLVDALWRDGRAASPDALLLSQRALAIRERVQGLDHPGMAVSLSSIGWVLRCRADYSEALPYLKRALVIREKALGPEHLEVAASLDKLAVALWKSEILSGEATIRARSAIGKNRSAAIIRKSPRV